MFEKGESFGWLLQAQDENKDKYYRIYSSEHRKLSRRPRLTIVARVTESTLAKSSDINRAELRTNNSRRAVSFELHPNYPNPFNPETTIRFQIPEAGRVVVRIFNSLGQEIRTLLDSAYEAGYHTARWDSKDNNGYPVSSGVYFYQLQASTFFQVRKMSLLR